MLLSRKQIILVLLVGLILCFTSTVMAEDFIELCKSGTAKEVKKAIKNGAEVNKKTDYGWTSLMTAAANTEDPEVVKVLADAGADLDARYEKNGWTPLFI